MTDVLIGGRRGKVCPKGTNDCARLWEHNDLHEWCGMHCVLYNGEALDLGGAKSPRSKVWSLDPERRLLIPSEPARCSPRPTPWPFDSRSRLRRDKNSSRGILTTDVPFAKGHLRIPNLGCRIPVSSPEYRVYMRQIPSSTALGASANPNGHPKILTIAGISLLQIQEKGKGVGFGQACTHM